MDCKDYRKWMQHFRLKKIRYQKIKQNPNDFHNISSFIYLVFVFFPNTGWSNGIKCYASLPKEICYYATL